MELYYHIPTIEELLTTVDYTKIEPATHLDHETIPDEDWNSVNIGFYEGNAYLWSSTDKCCTIEPKYKWVVYAYNGRTLWVDKESKIGVRFLHIYPDGTLDWTQVYPARSYNDALKLLNILNERRKL